MENLYLWIKAAHVISVIFWMAALLYLPRLFVYHHQSIPGGEMEQALIGQERRLTKIILTPAMISSFVFGLALLHYVISAGGQYGWLVVKLIALLGLFAIHGMMSADRKKFERGERPRTEKTYRILNEVPALLTIVIVIMAVVKPF